VLDDLPRRADGRASSAPENAAPFGWSLAGLLHRFEQNVFSATKVRAQTGHRDLFMVAAAPYEEFRSGRCAW